MSRTLILLSAAFLVATSAQAQVVGGGNSLARDCFLKTKTDDHGRKSSIKLCERALTEEFLKPDDEVATYVNKGILLMRSGNYEASLKSYDAAIELDPQLAEAYINRGACLIFLNQPEAAVQALSRSIELDTKHLPDALFNRAIAYERLGKTTAAYKDLKQASHLRPDWELPSQLLENYTVVTKSAD